MIKGNKFRKDIGPPLLEAARQDEKIVLLVCDMGFGVVEDFATQFPDRCFNMGMAEQGAVSIAAGMAMTGMKPIVYSIVNFLAYRSIEQIRNDVVLQHQNVKFIATGVNDYFDTLGHSHTCGEQDKEIMKMIGMPVYDPYEKDEYQLKDFLDMTQRWITSKEPGYLRL
ncbi:MAG: transketolase [bacterium]|nr:transketolase [bacterium]